MDNVHSEFIKADQLLNEYVKRTPKFKERFIALSQDVQCFIDAEQISGKVSLNELSLGYLLMDYFEDIRRLKIFHNVPHVNSIKIVAYTSYWFLRRKPIQVLTKDSKELIYINERFILAYILDFLSSEDKKLLLFRNESGLQAFKESMFYFLKCRFYGYKRNEATF